jgi:hypothetical protein
MGQRKLVAIVGVIALATVGCASEPTVDTTTASPSPAVTPAVTPAPTASPGVSPGTTTFAKPLVPGSPGAAFAAVPSVLGLIQPTNAKERGAQAVAQAKANQKDPFSGLPPTPIREPLRQQANNAAAGAGGGAAVAGAGTGGGTGAGATATANTQQRRLPSGSPLLPNPDIPPAIAVTVPRRPTVTATGLSPRPAIVLPPKPSTELAKGVEVTGVLLLSGIPQAIVKAPNEETSRYVRIGERLSNGRVLVKRIEMNTGAEPIVILEENGVEVSRSVGDKPASQAGRPNA